MSMATRRRGEELEAALLRAAWDELSEVGYAKLTIEAVAARARTSKPVLYRRWPTRALLVIAAMRQEAPALSREVPDSGSLRGDVLSLLRRTGRTLRAIGPDAVHGLFTEAFAELDFSEMRGIGRDAVQALLARAILRGEVRARAFPERVLTLPIDLVRHEILLTKASLSTRALEEIVDDVFLPLVLDSVD